MTQPKPEMAKKDDLKERTDPSTEGQVFSDPDDRTGNLRRPAAPLTQPGPRGKATDQGEGMKQSQSTSKEAKQVMDDEGGANQAGMK